MTLSVFEATWFLLLFTVFGTLCELLYKDKKYSLITFFLSSLGVILFSITHVSICSDYSSYEQIYSSAFNGSINFSDVIGLDASYRTLASIWGSLIPLDLDFVLSYHLFTAVYQTTSILILVVFLFFFCPRWKNTLLFFILFGSLQFQHIILCGIRHGLSSSITVLLFFAFINFITKREGYLSIVFLALLSVFTHWQAVIVILIIILLQIVTSKSFTSVFRSKTLKLFRSKIILVPVFTLIFIVLYAAPQIFTNLVIGFSEIVLSGQAGRISIYLDSSLDFEYGTKSSLLFYIDMILIYFSLFRGEIIKSRLSKGNDETDFNYCTQCKLLDWIGYLSIVNLIVKLLLAVGLGTLLRLSATIHLLQIFCIPVLLDSLKMKSRVVLVLLMSLPYLYFLFFISAEKFLMFV
ncbi:MAG: EpsG family protein [Cylindrospermopsis raciborskii]|uniref:EpsG family protein n=1 Tax=Cylindrospermopsis raciborskii TaxID=77022 RepID=UPI003D0DF5F4